MEVGRVQKENFRGDEKGDVSDCARALEVGRAVVLNPRMTLFLRKLLHVRHFSVADFWKIEAHEQSRGTIFYF